MTQARGTTFPSVINDITDTIDINSLTDIDCELLSEYLILFADDIVLFTINSVSLETNRCCSALLPKVGPKSQCCKN